MRHLASYYAIGFAIVGFLMLGAYFSTFISMVSNNYDPYGTPVLTTAILLPFVIAVLSWRGWKETQRNEDTEGGAEHEGA
ncbi:MAG: hypothetical protein ABSD73_06985 [Candidatus Bathyarchaeia archaeon]|jgi:membrane protein DedA with SNARE-associated domain